MIVVNNRMDIVIRIVVVVRIVGLICLCRLMNICYGSVFCWVDLMKSIMMILLNEVMNVNSVFDIIFGMIKGI